MDKLTVITEKRCTKCGVVKPRNEMRALSTAKDGMYPSCKECHNRQSREYKRTNRELMTQKQREYICKLRENSLDILRAREKRDRDKSRDRGYYREYYLKNKLHQRTKGRGYYLSNKDRWRKYGKTHRLNNPDKITENNHRRRVGWGTAEYYTKEQWKELCERYNNVCLCCGRKAKLTVDHVVPICKGGSNHISNIQPLCYPCNLRKWKQTIDYRY